MNDQELMSFAIARSNDPVIKNKVLRDALDKDLGPRIKAADGGLIDEALSAYNYYLKTRKSRPSKKRYKEIPFTKFFEIYGRENFDDGGRIALGVGGMPYKIFGKNIDIPKIPGVQGPEQNKKSVEEGFKKLEKWLTNPTPEKWNKIFGKNNTFGRQLRAYLLDEPIDLRKGTGLKETNKKVFDAINVKQLLKPNSIEKINLLTTGGKDVSLKSIAAKTFGNLKYTLDEQIKEVENFQNGEQWLKRNRSESEIRKYANAIRSMQSEKSRLGGFPFGDNSEKKLWSNLYRASYRGDRIEIVGDFADGNLPINKDGKVDWKMLDKKGVPAWKRVQFLDSEAPKNTTFTWGEDFKRGDFAKQIDDTFGEGFFKKSTVAYDTQAKTGSKRDFTVEGGGKTIKNNVKVKLLTAEALAENPKATKTEIDKYIKDKSPRFNITEVHHPDGVGVNPYKTEPTFRYANRAVGKVELALKAGKINQAEAKIQIDKINKDIGPVRIKLDDGYYGNYKNTQKSIVEASNNYVNTLTNAQQTRLASMGGKGCNGNFAPGGPVPNKIRCITKALDRLKNPENLGPGDKLNARKLFQSAGAKKFGNFLRGFGIPGEIVFESAFAIPAFLRGESGKRILGDTLLGFIGAGQSSEEEFLEYAKKKGLSDPTIELISDVNRIVDLGSNITQKEKTGRTTDPTELYNKVNPRGMRNVYKAEVDETNKIFDKYTMDQPQAKQQFNENMFSNAMQLGLDVEDDVQADKDKRIKEREEMGIISNQNYGSFNQVPTGIMGAYKKSYD